MFEMALSAAEKQRQHRARRDADPERRAAYLRTHRKRWHESKEQGKVKTVKDLGEREKRRKRRSWKKDQCECRKRAKLKEDQVSLTQSPEVLATASNIKVHIY